MTELSLTAAQRSSLLSLRRTSQLSERAQARLSSGREVNSVVDDATAFFRSRALSERATDFSDRLRDIQQAVQTVEASLQGIEAIDTLLRQARGIAESARSQTQVERTASTTQFEGVLSQVAQITFDTSYQGNNLLRNQNNDLAVRFGSRTASVLTINAANLLSNVVTNGALFTRAVFSSNGGASFSQVISVAFIGFSSIGSNNSNISIARFVTNSLDQALTRLRSQSLSFGNNVAILQTRVEFTQNYVNTLEEGSEQLVRADLNEEGASLVALQTRQALGIQALSVAGQQQQAILQLF